VRQHADNPVDWWPWSPEALAAAKDQDKPILLSVGYAPPAICAAKEPGRRSLASFDETAGQAW